MDKPRSSNHLKTFFQDHFTLKGRIALLTLYKIHHPKWFEVSLVLIEYLQLISQIILFLPDLSETTNHLLIFEIVTYSCKMINPSYLLSFENSDSISESIITLMFLLTILKYLIHVYIVMIAYWNKKGSDTIILIWRLVFKVQGRTWCYFITSFWVRSIISIRDEGFSLYGMNHSAAITLLSGLWAIEYILSFVIETQYCDVLPNKDFLSAKNSHLQLTTLGQKLILQILQLSLKGSLESRIWISSLFALPMSIFRIQVFFKTLSLYKMQALLFQGSLIGIVLALNLAYLFQAILISAEYAEPSIGFMITSGVLLSLLLVKASQGALWELILKLFSSNIAENYPNLLMHKTIFLKQLMKNERLRPKTTPHYHWTFLATKIIQVHQDSLFSRGNDESSPTLRDLSSSTSLEFNEISTRYLETLVSKFPEHRLTQLYFSSIGIKHLKISSKALKIIGSTMRRPWSTEYLSSFFLLCKFREVLVKDYQEKKQDILDLTSYIKGQKLLSELKQKMVDQAEMQISICQNILQDKCDIGEIFDKAQTISNLRKTLQREVRILPSKLPDYSIEHLLLCAEYYLVLEFSQTDCQKYCEHYYLRYLKYKKYLISPELVEENLYQSTNAFLILAGQSKENGIVKYCSNSGEKVLGVSSQDFISSHISSIFLPSMQSYYRNLFKRIFEKGQTDLLDQAQTVFLCHKDGYITESQIYIQVHPYLNENIYLSMIIRNSSVYNDYIILKENGDIEGATKRISKQLDLDLLTTSSINIKRISEDLSIANEAFNVVYLNNNNQPLAFENKISPSEFLHSPPPRKKSQHNRLIDPYQALALYNIFSSDGKEVQLSPFKAQNSELYHNYHCNIKVLSFGNSSLKVVQLSRINKKKGSFGGEEEEPKTPKTPKNHHSPRNFKRLSKITPVEEEEEEEECNFDTIPSEHRIKTLFNTDANLLTSQTQPDALITSRPDTDRRIETDRRLLTARKEEEHVEQEKYNNQKKELSSEIQSEKFEDAEQRRAQNLADFISVTTTTYKNTQEKAIYKAYRSNIGRKSYSKSFRLLCLVFYGVIFFTLLSQVILKIVYDDTMQGLVVRKDLLNYAQLRSYYASKICFTFMGLYGLTLGVNVWNIPGSLLAAPTVGLNALPTYYKGLAEASHNILNLLNRIDDQEIQNNLFMKDVRINGSLYDLSDQSAHLENNFEAVGLIVGATDFLVHVPDYNSSNRQTLYEYIRKNAQGDFLYKNRQVTDLFQESVDDQREYLRRFIIICLVLTPLLLSGVALLLMGIIWRQYSRECDYLKAFIKLDPNAIKSIRKDLEVFKNALRNDVSFIDKKMIEFFWGNSLLIETAQVRSRHSRRHDTQIIDDVKLRKRYFWYIVQVIIFAGILIGILLWNFLTARHNTDIIYNRQSQLQLSNYLSEQVSISIQGIAELFASNDTLEYIKMSPKEYVESAFSDLKTLQHNTIGGFLEINKTYDPQIKALLFDGEPCSTYKSYYYTYCTTLENSGVLTNVMSLMSYYIGLLEAKYQTFVVLDRSTLLKLFTSLYQGVNGLAVTASLLAYQAQIMNGIINENLTKSISNAEKNQNGILAVFIVCLVLVSLLIWIRILKRIKEVRNDFKKVLQVLPPKLVLSSFLLKQFLSRASGVVGEIQ